MGADVIKVEPPAGDSTRRMPGAVGTDSPSFNAVNRGKHGVVVDLKQAAGRDTVRRLAVRADVLVENYRPGVLTRLGLGYDELAIRHPGLVYASISGYGRTGPSAGKGGFDLVAQGVSGLMSVTGAAGGPPVRVGVPITDLGAGLFALNRYPGGTTGSGRDRTRPAGRHVPGRCRRGPLDLGGDPVLLRARRAGPDGLGASHERAVSGDPVRRRVRHHRRPPTTGAFAGCATPLVIPSGLTIRTIWTTRTGCATGSPWRRVSRRSWRAAAGRTGWRCSTRTTSRGGPINDYAQALTDPHILARGLVVETDHPTLGRIKTLGTPLKLSDTPADAGPPGAAARSAYRRRAGRGRVLDGRDRRAASGRRRGVVMTDPTIGSR